MYFISHIQNCGIFRTLFIRVFRYIQAYSALLIMHIHAYWDIIKTYLCLFMHLPNFVLPSHIHDLGIFWALAYLEREAYSKLCETLTRHIQNLAIARTVCSDIIQPYSRSFRTLCNASIWKNLAYLESWNFQNPDIFKTRHIFRTLSKT